MKDPAACVFNHPDAQDVYDELEAVCAYIRNGSYRKAAVAIYSSKDTVRRRCFAFAARMQNNSPVNADRA